MACNQIAVALKDIQKIIIITPFRLFEFTYMIFGPQNAAQTFQRLIDEVTSDLPMAFAYIDDILIASESPEQHREHFRILLQLLQEFGLAVNTAKSVFENSEVVFLDYVVNAHGIKPPQAWVQAIIQFSKPPTMKGLRRYFGRRNSYRKFIKCADALLVHLNALCQGPGVKGSHSISWTPKLEQAFEPCKAALPEAILLSHPNGEAEWAIFSDASDHAVEAVL